MRDTLHLILAFILAVIGTFFMMNGQLIRFIIYMPLDGIFIIVPLIIMALIFYKKRCNG
jgi:multisubunit Na+/H+ antiporter MnhC subunit